MFILSDDLFFVCCLTGSIVAMLLMDKLGRKVLLSGSFLGMVSDHDKWHFFIKKLQTLKKQKIC
jgi:hypothetical protein